MLTLPLLLLLQAAAAPQAAPPPPWTPRERVDPNNGNKSATASVTSREKNARLVVRCDNTGEAVVSVQYITKQPLGASADRPVSVTPDANPPVVLNWEFPGTAAFVREDNAVTALAAALAKAKTIKVSALTTANAPVEATFDGPPSDAPVKAVLAACGYQLGVLPTRKPAEPAPTQPGR